jgi:alginate O-acetyltransferase complex protein AlgI
MLPNFYLFLSSILIIIGYYNLSNIIQRKILLICASLILYAQFSVYYLIALVVIIIVTYFFGRFIANTRSKKILISGIAVNILILIIFKYSEGIGFENRFFAYPIGLSFYVFQSISYFVDVYRKVYEGDNDFINVSLYISFFPKLLAGPIEKVNKFLPQFNTIQSFDPESFFIGTKIILYGLFCKFVLADGLGGTVDGAVGNMQSLHGAEIFILSMLYSFQIYFDFFGYSILAIGTARLFNIRLSENFDRPYLSLSLKEFWSRWNITLYQWLRHYLYIPLGGSRVRQRRQYFNILVVFVISGLWHGATLNFLLWGILHGILFILEHKLFANNVNITKQKFWVQLIHIIVMYVSISLLWLVFRIDEFDLLKNTFTKLIDLSSWFTFSGSLKVNYYINSLVLLAFVFQGYNFFKRFIYRSENTAAFVAQEIIIINLLAIFILTCSSGGAGFIYFNF